MISNEQKAEAKKLIEALIKKMESHIKKIKEAKESERLNPFDKYPLDGYLKKAVKLRENYIMAYKEIDKQDSDFDFKTLFKNELKQLPKIYTCEQVKQMELDLQPVHRIKRLEKYDLGRLGRLNVEFLGGNKFEKMEA